jgi:transcriptional regulator with XRE-family HTH domain
MAIDQAHRRRKPELTPAQKAQLEAIRARRRTPDARAEEKRVREILRREYQKTGTLATAGDGIMPDDLLAFRRFITSLRCERERLGLSLSDVAKRAKIDKGALSRLENGQQLNPTVNTVTRYVRALGKVLTWGHTIEDAFQSDPRPRTRRKQSEPRRPIHPHPEGQIAAKADNHPRARRKGEGRR